MSLQTTDAAGTHRSVQGGGEASARRGREGIVRPKLVENADDHAANVVAVASRRSHGGDEQVERAGPVSAVERDEGRVELLGGAVLLETNSRGESVGGEASMHAAQDVERLAGLRSAVQDLRQRQRRVGAIGLELQSLPERSLVAVGCEHLRLRR